MDLWGNHKIRHHVASRLNISRYSNQAEETSPEETIVRKWKKSIVWHPDCTTELNGEHLV
jgi:hypothetical protein